MKHSHTHVHEAPQFDQALNQAEVLGAHFSRNREKYLFGAGILVGAVGMRFLGRPQVTVVTHLIQGGTSGV